VSTNGELDFFLIQRHPSQLPGLEAVLRAFAFLIVSYFLGKFGLKRPKNKIQCTYVPAKEAAEINETPYSTTFSYWQKRISTTLQRYNAKVLQQSQYKIARVTGLLNDDHNDLNSIILNDRHIYDVVV
jgi:hypothetical protein